MKAVLGISAYYHDSAAVMLIDGHIAAAAQEERFTRKKHDSSFPIHASGYVIEESGADPSSIAAIVFYEKPFLKFERLMETYHTFAPAGLPSFLSAMPVWIREKLFMKRNIRAELAKFGLEKVPVIFPEHHLSHAASAFYPSPFDEAAFITVDGVGEWATTTIGKGANEAITILRELPFPHSIGLLYSAFTYYCGFRVNSGEYKLMGLAPYGDPSSGEKESFKRKILEELVDIRPDGSLLLNMKYFGFATGLKMVAEKRWEKLFGIPMRKGEGEIGKTYMNMALAIQEITEEVVLKLAASARNLAGSENLVLAGGVALNCVANGKLLRSGIFKNIWIQPAAGDAGGALGAAFCGWHIHLKYGRAKAAGSDRMQGCFLGPAFTSRDVERIISRYEAKAEYFGEYEKLCTKVAGLLAEGNVVGWFQGRMEFGPRALGNRSILADPRNPEMQKRLNLKIKFREGFRPFAPSVLFEDVANYFELDRESPYMLLVAPLSDSLRKPVPDGYASFELYDRLYCLRSDLPAITHVDFSARIQTVHKDTNPRYWMLIDAFKRKTGIGLLVNTSFNVRGEPIVCRPFDAYRCFMSTHMDYLVVNDYLFAKADQSAGAQWQSALGVD